MEIVTFIVSKYFVKTTNINVITYINS